MSSVIEFEEFLKFAEFSWKYIATNQAKSIEPGVKNSPHVARRQLHLESFVESFEENVREDVEAEETGITKDPGLNRKVRFLISLVT